MRYLLIVVVFFCYNVIWSQQGATGAPKSLNSASTHQKEATKKSYIDSIKSLKVDKPSISAYKIISYSRDTTYLDTTLTLKKDYQFNYLRKDNFEILPFANMGQSYNSLGFNFERTFFYPKLGASAKHFNYLEMEDITYYSVPTPTTDAMFKTVFDEGQLLDILLTFNLSKRLNYSIAYKGFRSLGKYVSSEAESGNFRTTANYESKNNRYNLRLHIAVQNIVNQENGGLVNKEQFESGDKDFIDRSRIDVNFTDAENRILGKRYFFEHQYQLVRKQKDSSFLKKTSLALAHLFNYETKYYKFNQSIPNEYFGEAFLVDDVADKAQLKVFYNQLSAEFSSTILGRIKGSVNLYNYNYFFNSLLVLPENITIDSQLKGEEIALGADYEKKIGGFRLKGNMAYNLSGKLTGALINASAGYAFNDHLDFSAAIYSSSRMPDFNFLLYQSDYKNYNWQHTDVFEKLKTNSLQFTLNSKLLGEATVKFTTIDNYSYFAFNATLPEQNGESQNKYIQPYQESSSVNYMKVTYKKELKYRNFALENTIMYQAVEQSNDVLNVPQLTTRNTLYFAKEVFKKALFLQTGLTFKYFSSYYMNAYNPLLGEFYIQNNEKIGGFPVLDFFINAKVQQTRIYLKAEHFNSSFSGSNYYSAPNYPYRDFIVRFGVVWNFFS